MNKKPTLSWNTSQIIEDNANTRFDDGEYQTLEEAIDACYNDDLTFEWESLTDYLTELLDGKEFWKIKGEKMGWRNLSGEKYLQASTGIELLRGILPNTDCTFYIHKNGKGFTIRNYHHDAPTGEIYDIVPVATSTYYNNQQN